MHRGPPLLGLAIVFTLLFAGSLIGVAALTGGGHFPSPYAPAADAAAYFAAHPGAVALGAFLQLGAAIPLGLYAATASSRLRFLGIEAAGATIALFGGVAASVFLALSALVQWVLAQPGVAGGDAMRGLQLLAFAAGGPGHVATFGLLVAGVSVSAGLPRLIPRWLLWFGLVIAACAELSTLTVVAPAAAYLLPAARFLGLVWMIAVGATLPTIRSQP